MFNRKLIENSAIIRKSHILFVILVWLFYVCVGTVHAQSTESTSFEGLSSGDFLIGSAPLTAVFTGGNAGTRGVPAFYHSGRFSWHIDGRSSALVQFATPASEIDFWFRDTPNGGPLLIRVIDVNGAVVAEATGTQIFENIVVSRVDDQALIDRIEFENPGSNDSVVDDFAFTAEVQPVDPADIPEPVIGPITQSIGTGAISVSYTHLTLPTKA